jgi:hypothetical protein
MNVCDQKVRRFDSLSTSHSESRETLYITPATIAWSSHMETDAIASSLRVAAGATSVEVLAHARRFSELLLRSARYVYDLRECLRAYAPSLRTPQRTSLLESARCKLTPRIVSSRHKYRYTRQTEVRRPLHVRRDWKDDPGSFI